MVLILALIFLILSTAVGWIIFTKVKTRKGIAVAILSASLSPLLVITVCFCGILIITRNPTNDIALWRFTQNFNQISHPLESELVAEASDMGLLTGASNHCDYYAGQLRWTTQLSQQKIRNWYQGMAIPKARSNGSSEDIEMLVIFVDTQAPKDARTRLMPYSWDSLADWNIDPSLYQNGQLYIVQAFDIGYPPGNDMRCH